MKKTKRNKFGGNDDEFYFGTVNLSSFETSGGEDPLDNWINETKIQEKFSTELKDL